MRTVRAHSMLVVTAWAGAVGCSSPNGRAGDAGVDHGTIPDLGPSGAVIGGCRLFPTDHVCNLAVADAPVHPRSAAWLARMRAVSGAHPREGASSLVWAGSRAGIPVNVGGVARTLVTDGSYGSAIAPFTTTMPTMPRIEGEPNEAGAWDRHVLTVDPATCRLTEVIQYRMDPTYGPLVSGGVDWDLAGYAYATPVVPGAAPAEAAGLPIASLLFRYDEVASGHVDHAIRVAGDAIASTGPLWPAVRTDGRDTHTDAMPMGARLRLRGDADLSMLGPSARVLAVAMQTYGLVIADSTPDGDGWVVVGEGDARWDDADLATLRLLDLAAFEVVDLRGYVVADGSLRAAHP